MDLNHRSLAYETSGDDRPPPLRCVYLPSVTPDQLMVNLFWINWRKDGRIELHALTHTFCFQDRVRPSLINLP